MTHEQLLALTGDQIKYFDFSLKWPDLLKQNIPFGFPLFLRLIPIQALPYVTLAMWISSLGFLTWCLAKAGFRRSMILGIMAPLSISIAMRPWDWHGNPYFYANTERLTTILSAVLLGLVVCDNAWAAILTFIICLVRPAMLFLPAVVFLTKPSWKMLRALVLPFTFFLFLRLAIAGEPIFCSYGAYNASRIYAMMVEPGDLAKVPEKFHPLMIAILNKHLDTGGIEFDRPNERDLYHRWYNGDQYQTVIKGYDNAFLRELWGYEFRLHWKERVSIYFRALRVAAGKFQDPILLTFLALILWFKSATKVNIYWPDIDCIVPFIRWFGLWTFFSITTLLLVQFPDDRYMQICFLWLPSMLGCAIGFIW